MKIKNPYKYGLVLLTNDPKIKGIDVKDGIYVAIKSPDLELWLDQAKARLGHKIEQDLLPKEKK